MFEKVINVRRVRIVGNVMQGPMQYVFRAVLLLGDLHILFVCHRACFAASSVAGDRIYMSMVAMFVV